MNIYVNQSITIQYIKIGSISNSAIFQIGSAGMIKAHSHLYNTGSFTKPAPKVEKMKLPPTSIPLANR